MRQIYFLSICCMLAGTSLFAQDEAQGCDGQRYFYEVFDEVQKTTVQFGENINISGVNQELYMDVYEPMGDDLEARPTIVWAFGGAFITGNREDMEETCIEFARRGFVSVTVDYRLYNIFLGIPDSLVVAEVVIQAIGDMKAAIRALRMDAATVNEFRVDTNLIIGGGVSAGGILAAHCAYLDEEDDIPDFFLDLLEDNGGLEGNSGDATNLSYSSDIMLAISLSGALYDADWMEAGDPPFASMHGTEDDVVPYLHGFASAPISPGVNIQLMSMDGSGLISQRATDLEIPNFHISVPDGGHEDIYLDPSFEDYRNSFTIDGGMFLYDQMCPSIDLLPSSTTDLATDLDVRLFPNPASQYFVIQPPITNKSYDLSIVDALGKEVFNAQNLIGDFEWQRQSLPKGMYHIQLLYKHRSLPIISKKLVIQ